MTQTDLLHSEASRKAELGGITIIVALILLAVMTVGAFSLSRNTLRDATTSGYSLQGIKAAEAGDAGLDWFLVWGHPDNEPAATSTARQALVESMALMQVKNSPPTYPGRPWDVAKDFISTDADTADDMAFDTSGAKIKQNASGGNATRQRFDLFVRFLGEAEYGASGASESGDPAKGKANKSGASDLRWQARSTGIASVDSGTLVYRSVREMVSLQSRRQIQVTAP